MTSSGRQGYPVPPPGEPDHEKNAPLIRARIVAEGANGLTTLGPTSSRRSVILVIPDVLQRRRRHRQLFEWVQDISAFFWSKTRSTRLNDHAQGKQVTPRGGSGGRAKQGYPGCGLPPLCWL